MRIRGNEGGMISFKVLFILTVLFLIGHVGYKLVPMYMDFYRMEDEMTSQASVAQVLKDEEIMANLVKKTKALDLPLKEENFVLKRDEERHRLLISTAWDVEVHFLFDVYVRTFHFAPQADEDYLKTHK